MDKEKFTDNDIRPAESLKGQAKALEADIQWLLGRKQNFVEVACPACNGKDTRELFKKNEFRYEECNHCRTFFVNPRPTPEILEDFYKSSANYAYWNKYIFPASAQARKEKIFTPRVDYVLEFCEKYNIDMGSILEVGAGFGFFCEVMKSRSRFERVMGIEPTPDLANTCRNKGIEIIELPVEKVQFDDGKLFDVVVNFEVIEHLFSPADFINNCRKFLKDKGIFILTCPNGKGFDVITLKKLSKTVDHEHLNYFNPDSLKLLLEKSGFTILEITTPGILDAELVRNEIVAGAFDISNQPFLQKVLIDDWETLGHPFQQFITNNMLSSNMCIVAQRTRHEINAEF